jgi:Uncharacterised protein family (UPF0160)
VRNPSGVCGDQNTQIIELAAGGVPWKEHLYELEKQEGIEGGIKFCLYEVRILLLVTHAIPASLSCLNFFRLAHMLHTRATRPASKSRPGRLLHSCGLCRLQAQLLMLCTCLSL